MIASQSAALSAQSRTGVAGSESGNFLKEKMGFNPIFKHAPGPGRSRIHRAFTRSAPGQHQLTQPPTHIRVGGLGHTVSD